MAIIIYGAIVLSLLTVAGLLLAIFSLFSLARREDDHLEQLEEAFGLSAAPEETDWFRKNVALAAGKGKAGAARPLRGKLAAAGEEVP